jgi:DNA-binding SARP family transcriptional activator
MARLNGVAINIPAAKQRIVLAALLLNANRVVTIDWLTEQLWAEKPPKAAKVTLQNYVRRLRLAIGDADHARITTAADGYSVVVADDELDIFRVEELEKRADRAADAGAWDEAAQDLAMAEALWRGRPLADLPDSQLFLTEAQRLTELRMRVVESRIEADVHLGRHRKVIPELERLAGDDPSRERLHELLMLALYRDGRQAEALRVYPRARKVLIEEFGIEPRAELQRLHQRILLRDDGLAPQPPPADRGRTPADHDRHAEPVPRQLPPAVRGFVGRERELKILDSLADEEARPGAPGIAVISGSAGVGKTALAVQWGHQAGERFPDGHLFIDLRGFDPTGAMMDPAEAIRGLLDAMHPRCHQVPADTAAQAALYRSLISGKRLLIILDNAYHADQVQPLLPAAPGCLVIVTSRNALSRLAAAGALHIGLDVLTEGEGVRLLATRLGAERLQAEAESAREVVRLCAGLPLAAAIAAARAVTRPRYSLAALAGELRDTRTRLDMLAVEGDATMDVRSVFSWSYQHLSEAAARMFRLLGAHPGPGISAQAAASLAGVPVPRARQVLAELTMANLLVELSVDRFTSHDLLRMYAAERARLAHDQNDDAESVRRAVDHYLNTANSAALLLNPGRDPVTLPPCHPGAQVVVLRESGEALAWFRTERETLLRVVSWAASEGLCFHSWRLAWALVDFLDRHGYWTDQASVQRVALTAAERSADLTGQAHAHHFLSLAFIRLGAHEDAERHLLSALDLFGKLGNRAAQARVQLSLGRLLASQGRFDAALTHAELSGKLFRSVGHRLGHANALNNVGWYWAHAGRLERALRTCQQSLGIFRELGDRSGEARTRDSIGYVYLSMGRYEQAIDAFHAATVLYVTGGDRYNQAETLTRLGDAYRAADQPSQARAVWEEALAILDDLRHPATEKLRANLRDLDPARR